MNVGIKSVPGLLVSVSFIISLLLMGCISNPGGENLSSPANSDNQQFSLTNNSSPEYESSGIPPTNPKLDTRLNLLIQAEYFGQAEAYAQQHAIKLVDGKVLVEIRCFPGGLEAAVKATAAVGTVYSTSTRLNGIVAVVPLISLTALSKEESIQIIRSPMPPELL